MFFQSLALAALATSAVGLVHPKRHGHHYHGSPSGSDGTPMPTGGAVYPTNSAGSFNGSDASTSSVANVAVMTMTVIPLPAATVSSSSSSSADVHIVATSAPVAPVQSGVSSSSSCEDTTTLTSTNYRTLTIAPVGDDGKGSPAITTMASATASEVAYIPGSSVVAAEFMGPQTATTSSSSVTVLYTSSIAEAAEFYQQPSSAGPYVMSVATTLATSTVVSASMTMSGAGSSATASSFSGVSTSGKRGLAYNVASLTAAFSGKGMSWAYNWGAAPDGTLPSGLEFVPMLWGLNMVSSWSSAASAAISSGASHLLSFNEPDLSSQSNMSPAVAATNHIQYMNPFAGQAQIGSPAVTNGAGSSPAMGTTWLSQFFSACGGQCKVDFVTFHWYDSAGNIAGFKQYVSDVISTAQANGVSKVWLTEFGASGSDSDAAAFLQEALPFLDSTPAVERYAYFMCGGAAGQLISGSSVSTIGSVYASA